MEEELTDNLEQETTEIESLEEIKKTLDEEKAKAENYLSNWQRAQADFINYKRRSEHEKEETIKLANSALMLSLLPVLDDFERALNAILPEQAEASWLEGVKLIERKLKTSLEQYGLSIIEATGKTFNPHLHEAVRQAKGREGMIVEEVQRGYKLYDRVIRPSKVVVGNGEGEE